MAAVDQSEQNIKRNPTYFNLHKNSNPSNLKLLWPIYHWTRDTTDHTIHIQGQICIEQSLTVIDTQQIDKSNPQRPVRLESLLLPSKLDDANGHDMEIGKSIEKEPSVNEIFGHVHIHAQPITQEGGGAESDPDESPEADAAKPDIQVRPR